MALFQKSVLRKYLTQQDVVKVNDAWNVYQKHFLNTEIQTNIRSMNEEQYQAGFLVDLFVKVLGYTINPTPGFNLTTEYKNEKDSKKADGALIFDDKVLAVIELKGTNTTDLNKIEAQGFGYKNNQKDCIYVITSNFEKLRFYIDNAIEHIEFNLFKLSREEFELLYLCLHKRHIQQGIPKKIKDESIVQEEDITKKLYKDYSHFKRVLFTNLCERNPDRDQLEIFKKTQKLLDRFLFVFFAEDRGLIPPYSVRRIVREWDTLKDLDVSIPLLDRFRQFFGYFNSGYRGKEYEIFAYNGGLFAPDDFLDSIQIDDDLLYQHTVKIADYNFASEVDVNILGHIFENSLNEIDEIKAQIAGETIDKTKTKRKKDGVFYTPKYITKYIVENTVGKLCNEKKIELGIDIVLEDGTFPPSEGDKGGGHNKIMSKKAKEKEYTKLQTYRNWLLQLTICDPACGSGAFLNQALEFLIAEHRYIDELQAKLFGDALVLSDVENSILENNLYGVDLNEESVEIAKLSLWLRTAQPNRKLNNLNNNIKCGNSLIDDPEVAGDKAFNWEQEFPKVFQNAVRDKNYLTVEERLNRTSKKKTGDSLGRYEDDGYGLINEFHEEQAIYETKGEKKYGFDVVIGNPPYVPTEYISDKDKVYLESKYESAFGRINLYPIFYELGLNILRENGRLSYITPYTILKNQYYKASRNFILKSSEIIEIIDFKGVVVFKDAAVDSIILSLVKKIPTSDYTISNISEVVSFENSKFSVNNFSVGEIINQEDLSFQFSSNEKLIKKISDRTLTLKQVVDFKQGIITGGNSKYITDVPNELSVNFITGGDFNRFSIQRNNNYLTYDTTKLHRPRTRNIFEVDEKIVLRQTGAFPICTIDTEKLFTLDTVHNGHSKNSNFKLKYIVTLLNSKLLKFIYKNKINEDGKVFAQVKIIYIDELPIKNISLSEQQSFIEKADLMLQLNKDLQTISSKFLALLISELNIDVPSKAIQNWYELSFTDFAKELKKKKVELSLSQKSEWMDFFETEKQKAVGMKAEIDKTDREIDCMVYELYGLSEEEIKIVEGL